MILSKSVPSETFRNIISVVIQNFYTKIIITGDNSNKKKK